MKRQYIKIFLLFVIIIIVVPLYILVHGYTASHLPIFLIKPRALSFVSVKGRLAIITIGGEFAGSLVVALVTLLPVGYMFPKRWSLVSAVLVAITLAVLISVYPTDTTRSRFMDVLRVGEYLGVIVAYFLMALLGSGLSRHTPKTDV